MDSFKLTSSIPSKLDSRRMVETIIRNILQASDPAVSVRSNISFRNGAINLAESAHLLPIPEGIRLVSIGKAAFMMGKAAVEILGDKIIGGLVIGKAIPTDIDLPQSIRIMQGGHPIPDGQSLQAGQALRDFLQQSYPNLPVLFLISGGGSSLVTCPPDGITLDDLANLNRVLVGNHLAIDEINIIRKHLDLVKGGGLLRWLDGTPSLSLILSDVVSGQLEMVASGPTMSDRSTFHDALSILEQKNLTASIPLAIPGYLKDGSSGLHPETIKPEELPPGNHINVEIGSLKKALKAAGSVCQEFGWEPVSSAEPIEGPVENVSERLIREIQKYSNRHQLALIYGGEATVNPNRKGKGGRNTHLAYLLAEPLQKYPGVTVITFATDGEDGNCPACGAVVDNHTYTKSMQLGMDFSYYGDNFDSYSFFEKLNDLIVTGPTGTNVNDILIILIE
jgi:hydroxypyruvate reductase